MKEKLGRWGSVREGGKRENEWERRDIHVTFL